jgi:hypothetical protein
MINLEDVRYRRGEEFSTSGGVKESDLHMIIFLKT